MHTVVVVKLYATPDLDEYQTVITGRLSLRHSLDQREAQILMDQKEANGK